MHGLFTRNLAEAWRLANPTPQPAKLSAFVANDPRPLPCIPTPGISLGALKLGLYGAGAVLLGIVGWLVSHH